MTPGRPRGLRAMVTAAFAVGALLLSLALAAGTYFVARHYLVEQRERSATRQAFADAAVVRDGLLTSGAQVSEVLGSISPPRGTVMFVHRDGEWYSSSLTLASRDVSATVRDDVAAGDASVGWTGATPVPATVVGVPLAAAGAEFYEVAVAVELNRTLATLRIALVICAAITTIAGAVLGRLAARRLLAPLGDVTTAATRISAGQMHTRLHATDDPDLAALVASFNTMVDDLDERIRRDARFAADVSHELRSPLTTLTTSVTVLRNSADLPERSRQAVELMAVELVRFRRSLEDLLTLGRLEAGVLDTRVVDVDLRQLVRDALEHGRRDPGLLEPAPDRERPAWVRVDPQQVDRVLANLFENADAHGGGLTRVTVVGHDSVIDVQVDDSGDGIPAEDRERVFERFARLGSRRSGTGTGLGLSIVAETMRQQGGTAWCATSDTGGARLVIRFPRSDPLGGDGGAEERA